MECDYTKQHSANADVIMDFVCDESIWNVHSSFLNRSMGSPALPLPVYYLYEHLHYLFKLNSIIDDGEALYFLRDQAKETLNKKNNLIHRFFGTVSTDKFEIEFLTKICNAKDLQEIVDWINEAIESKRAYKSCHAK